MTDEHLSLDAEDGVGGEPCPGGCGREFDQREWPVESHGGDAWGGVGTHSCPTEGCGGTVSVGY